MGSQLGFFDDGERQRMAVKPCSLAADWQASSSRFTEDFCESN